jgi:hypothetical protein
MVRFLLLVMQIYPHDAKGNSNDPARRSFVSSIDESSLKTDRQTDEDASRRNVKLYRAESWLGRAPASSPAAQALHPRHRLFLSTDSLPSDEEKGQDRIDLARSLGYGIPLHTSKLLRI